MTSSPRDDQQLLELELDEPGAHGARGHDLGAQGDSETLRVGRFSLNFQPWVDRLERDYGPAEAPVDCTKCGHLPYHHEQVDGALGRCHFWRCRCRSYRGSAQGRARG